MLAESALCCSVAKLPIADQALPSTKVDKQPLRWFLAYHVFESRCSSGCRLAGASLHNLPGRALARLVKHRGKQRWCSVLLMVLAGELFIPSRAPTCGLTSSCARMSMAELTCRIDQVLTIH